MTLISSSIYKLTTLHCHNDGVEHLCMLQQLAMGRLVAKKIKFLLVIHSHLHNLYTYPNQEGGDKTT